MAASSTQLSLARGAHGIMPAIYPTRLHLNTGNAVLLSQQCLAFLAVSRYGTLATTGVYSQNAIAALG